MMSIVKKKNVDKINATVDQCERKYLRANKKSKKKKACYWKCKRMQIFCLVLEDVERGEHKYLDLRHRSKGKKKQYSPG